MHPVRGHDPLCYPHAREALPASPEALLMPRQRGAGPSALRLRCQRTHGMINGTKLLGHANGQLTQPCCSFYPLACSDDHRALIPRRPSWRRGWPGQA
jgi:hypothetical protein